MISLRPDAVSSDGGRNFLEFAGLPHRMTLGAVRSRASLRQEHRHAAVAVDAGEQLPESHYRPRWTGGLLSTCIGGLPLRYDIGIAHGRRQVLALPFRCRHLLGQPPPP